MSELEAIINVLYVCDHGNGGRRVQEILNRPGYVVETVIGGYKEVAKSRNVNFDIVIVDQMISLQDSVKVVRHIAVASDRFVPIILLAPMGSEQLAVEAMAAGASDFLIKDAADGYLTLLPPVVERALYQGRFAEEQQRTKAQIELTLRNIERAKQEWEATVDSLNQLVGLLDDRGSIIRANLTVEHWQLARVAEVRGLSLHELLHSGCDDPACYMDALWTEAWATVKRGQTAEFEIHDRIIGRYLSLQIQPISTETSWRDKLETSYAVFVVSDITERKQAEAALYQQTRELQVRNEELNAFAHTVAHDLQNPLGLIIGFASALNSNYDVLPADDVKLFLNKIMTSSHKMSKIIKELLLLASVRQQEVELKPIDTDDLVCETQRRLAVMIEDYRAEIIAPEEWPVALGYGPWVEEVWVNYISNAIKYGGTPPQIELGASTQDDGMLRFWVSDNGRGLSLEEQNQLFEPFKRLAQGQAKGHGLGLSIVRRIVEKLGGQVHVESRGASQGTVFSFTLPEARDAQEVSD